MPTDDIYAKGLEWRSRIKSLSEAVWEGHAKEQIIQDWLGGFVGEVCDSELERYYGLCLLQQFIYFGKAEIDALLYAMFRDHILYPQVQRCLDINPSLDDFGIRQSLENAVGRMKIVPVGDVSESAAMLTYRLRQEAGLPPDAIKTVVEVLEALSKHPGSIDHVVLTDDFLGTGNQLCEKHADQVAKLKSLGVRVEYVALVAMQRGVDNVRRGNLFDDVTPVILLDRSYSLSELPCVLLDEIEKSLPLTRLECLRVVENYGAKLYPNPLGYENCGVMIGFHHNTPDNALPLFWKKSKTHKWTPVFERKAKVGAFHA
jgi:hypothetical protein